MRHVPTPDDLSLAVHHLGDGARPTLLCHATGFHGAVWEPMAESLGSGFDRHAIDFRAHGATHLPAAAPLSWDRFAVDVLAAVDGLGLRAGEILGVGHSMGGAALLLAEQARPGTFAGLWVYEPITPPRAFAPSMEGGNRLAEGAARRRATFASHAEALENYASKPPLDVLHPEALAAYVRHGFAAGEDGAVHLACRPLDESRIYRGGAAHDAHDHLGEVHCPVVVACGRNEPGPVLFAPSVAGALPHGRLERFDQLGHFGPLEDPAGCAAAVQAFAAEL